MAFKVRISTEAEKDAQEILEWLLAEGAGEAGIRWFLQMEEAIASLSEMPHRCKIAPEGRMLQAPIRELLFGKRPYAYRILFITEGDIVHIVHIRHGRRMPPSVI